MSSATDQVKYLQLPHLWPRIHMNIEPPPPTPMSHTFWLEEVAKAGKPFIFLSLCYTKTKDNSPNIWSTKEIRARLGWERLHKIWSSFSNYTYESYDLPEMGSQNQDPQTSLFQEVRRAEVTISKNIYKLYRFLVGVCRKTNKIILHLTLASSLLLWVCQKGVLSDCQYIWPLSLIIC